MSVNSFNPRTSGSQTITVTAGARAHLREQIERSSHSFLRLGVKESGCNGYMYTLDYIDGPVSGDKAYDIGDSVIFYVSARDLPMVQGTEVDYVTEGLNSSLKFKNANAASYCGCGESFAVPAASQ